MCFLRFDSTLHTFSLSHFEACLPTTPLPTHTPHSLRPCTFNTFTPLKVWVSTSERQQRQPSPVQRRPRPAPHRRGPVLGGGRKGSRHQGERGRLRGRWLARQEATAALIGQIRKSTPLRVRLLSRGREKQRQTAAADSGIFRGGDGVALLFVCSTFSRALVVAEPDSWSWYLTPSGAAVWYIVLLWSVNCVRGQFFIDAPSFSVYCRK